MTYEEAIMLFDDRYNSAFQARDFGSKPGQCAWYFYHFVQYVSELGYHIELTGDEFESPVAEIRT